MVCMTEHGPQCLRVVYGDVTLGLHGDGFDYIFSHTAGGPVSMVLDGREWLYRAPRPTFWRATTDNDRGSGFSCKSAMWMGADLFVETEEVRVFADGEWQTGVTAPENNRHQGEVRAREVRVEYTYRTPTVPQTTVDFGYTVDAQGSVRVDVRYHGAKGLPQLPVFGLRLIMPTAAEGYVYQGLSGETYPDRMAGGVRGRYEVKGLPVTPYLVPQDCGVHMETEELVVTRSLVLANEKRGKGAFSLKFSMTDRPFACSCLPYTALELESATHQEELPPARRTVVCILGAVRGVGGIDSWGSDVERDFWIDAEKDIAFSFRMERGL
ncbi:MAG: beta-galactosidase small subunit [Enterocloster asparagiformis]|nr:beta-galactosidase small subunit [Enterocloster asparagiformis]